MSESWAKGIERAYELGVPCIEYAHGTNEATDVWEPGTPLFWEIH